MFILTFYRSSSQYFQRALDMALSYGASWDGEKCVIEIPDKYLLDINVKMSNLIQMLRKWKKVEASYNGKKVKWYDFVITVHYGIRSCVECKKQTSNMRYCWIDPDQKGWGCRLLTRMQRYSVGTPYYKSSTKHWYNYGEFIKPDLWKVNKKLIMERLEKEMDTKLIHICPYFDIAEVEGAVHNLPDTIIIDNIHFTIYYSQEYMNGEKKMVPINIRHVPPHDKTIHEFTLRQINQWN